MERSRASTNARCLFTGTQPQRSLIFLGATVSSGASLLQYPQPGVRRLISTRSRSWLTAYYKPNSACSPSTAKPISQSLAWWWMGQVGEPILSASSYYAKHQVVTTMLAPYSVARMLLILAWIPLNKRISRLYEMAASYSWSRRSFWRRIRITSVSSDCSESLGKKHYNAKKKSPQDRP